MGSPPDVIAFQAPSYPFNPHNDNEKWDIVRIHLRAVSISQALMFMKTVRAVSSAEGGNRAPVAISICYW